MTDTRSPRKSLDPARPDGYGWDWTSTTHVATDGIVPELLDALGAAHVTRGKGIHGWSQSVNAFDAGGYKAGSVFFGGGRDDVFVQSSSHQAHDARRAVVGIGEARTARVDTRVDTQVPFNELRSILLDLAGPRTKVRLIQSVLDKKNAGRTVYIGSPTSAVQVRLYEKWLESPGLYVDGVNRVEVQLRPPSRAKSEVSGWSPAETFCVSKLTRRIADALETEIAHPVTMQKAKPLPDFERSLGYLGSQYGPTFTRWMDFSGGDLGRVLDYLNGEVQPDSL